MGIYKATSNVFKKVIVLGIVPLMLVSACAQVEIPGGSSIDIPPAEKPRARMKGINEKHQAIVKIPLGRDVLVPVSANSDLFPDVYVGPFELRSETLAGALQLILADYDISMAFETEEGMTRRITIANLRGKIQDVVERVCGLADLYCAYKDGSLTIKETETFIVDLPPIGDGSGFDQIVTGLNAVIGSDAALDTTTNVLVYNATHRTNRYAKQYFERLRKSTALIVFETHIWEVSLDNENRTGINWSSLLTTNIFDFNVNFPGSAPAGAAAPITITPTYTGSNDLTANGVFEFISEHGAVKTVSQPQLTVLSGSTATLNVQRTENYVSEFTRTVDDTTGDETVSTTTDSIESGLVITIASGWDQSTVYGNLDIQINELIAIDNFSPTADSLIQLPKTTTRSLQTQVRVRPGDAILIAGLVTERDNYSGSGPGFLTPLLESSRGVSTENTELVFLLRPRVVAFMPEAMIKAEEKEEGGVVKTLSSLFDKAPDKDRNIEENQALFKEQDLPMGGISLDALAPRNNIKSEDKNEE